MIDRFRIGHGPCQDYLATLPPGSVHTAVTSPPYWNQREYAGGLGRGNETWLDCGAAYGSKHIDSPRCGHCYVCGIVADAAAVHHVLRNDGTFWFNIGDKFGRQPGAKIDQLLGVPWRIAFAMQAAGWLLQSDVIWHKPDAMPGGAKDRCVSAHEYVFQFTKTDRYFFDHEAINEPAVYDGNRTRKRDVWKIPTARLKEAHFATFPIALVETCILASTSARGVCPTCGAPWERIVQKRRFATRPGNNNKFTGKAAAEVGNRDKGRNCTATATLGWKPGCKCYFASYRDDTRDAPAGRAVILDPYLGSGTTIIAANRHGRLGIGCDVSAEYVDLATKRIRAAQK